MHKIVVRTRLTTGKTKPMARMCSRHRSVNEADNQAHRQAEIVLAMFVGNETDGTVRREYRCKRLARTDPYER
jgi:hypothetical protein